MDNNEIKLQKVYSNLYNEIVQPDRVCVITQYFRTQWMPRLNPRLAWLIINLRQHCYWNKQTGELRDWCIVDQEELSRELGADKKTLRRLMKSDGSTGISVRATRYSGFTEKQKDGKVVAFKIKKGRLPDEQRDQDTARLTGYTSTINQDQWQRRLRDHGRKYA